MNRKIIFTGLALTLALALGSILYETWVSGHISVSSMPIGHGRTSSDFSHSADRSKFLFHFWVEVFGSLCAVVMLLGLGWVRTKKQPNAS